MSRKNRITIILLLCVVGALVTAPLLMNKRAEFGGSDDAGSVMIEEITGSYEPWAAPVLEIWLHGELPGEIESLLFCLQTGIGVGILAFCLGRLVERKKWEDREMERQDD